MSGIKIKAIGSDKKRIFIKKLVTEAVCKVHEEYGDELDSDKDSSHLIQCIMNFIETTIATSKHYKEEKFDKKKILYLILNELYKGEYEEESLIIENAVRHIIDNKLVKVTKSNFFFKIAKSAVSIAKDLLS
jgi:hypothetical protein